MAEPAGSDDTVGSTESRRTKESKKDLSSSSSSSEGATRGYKQVQFGTIRTSDVGSGSSASTVADESIPENVNERLRHQVPVVEQFVETKRLSRVMATMSTVIFQMAHQEIGILRNMYFSSKVATSLEYVPLSEKYSESEYDMDIIVNPSEEFLAYKKAKKDICWIEKILGEIIINLQKDSYYDDFVKILNDDELTRQEERALLGAKEFNRKELQKLKRYIDSEKLELMRQIQETTKELGNSKDQLNDDIAEFSVKMNYLKEWQKSRHEQNRMILEEAENKLLNTKKNMQTELEKEERVHQELFLYLENSLKDYRTDIDQWMEKYDHDLEEKEQQVAQKKLQIENQKDEFEQLTREYHKRQKEIDDYKEYKMLKEQEAREVERRNEAATKIQSWWRGVLFRRGVRTMAHKKGKGTKSSSGGKTNSADKKK